MAVDPPILRNFVEGEWTDVLGSAFLEVPDPVLRYSSSLESPFRDLRKSIGR